MKKVAIFACVWLVCSIALGFGAVAYGDGDHHHHGGGNCEYEHGVLHCGD